MTDTNVQRMLAGKTRKIAYEVFTGFEAVKNVQLLYSQYASLGGDSMKDNPDVCEEQLPERALPVTQNQLYQAKEALGIIASLIAPIAAQIPAEAWAALEILNVREAEVR